MIERPKYPQHFTASGLVICREHVLLVYHRRIKAWLPPGGHIEEYELPHEAAVREVFEETGVAVEVVSDAIPITGDPDAFFLLHPLCIHAVHAFEGGKDVYHLDIAYLMKAVDSPSSLPALAGGSDVADARWVPLADVRNWDLAKNVIEALDLAQTRADLLTL